MIKINNLFDLIMPEITMPKKKEMIGDFIKIDLNNNEQRRAMHTIAKYFMREIQIDSVLFPNPKTKTVDDDEKECHGYLLTLEKSSVEMKSIVIGAVCFRLRPSFYGLQWIWLHPFARNVGILSKHWKLFKDKFGKNLYCEPPYTYSMQGFLDKHHEKHHKEYKNEIPHWLNRIVIK